MRSWSSNNGRLIAPGKCPAVNSEGDLTSMITDLSFVMLYNSSGVMIFTIPDNLISPMIEIFNKEFRQIKSIR